MQPHLGVLTEHLSWLHHTFESSQNIAGDGMQSVVDVLQLVEGVKRGAERCLIRSGCSDAYDGKVFEDDADLPPLDV